MSFFGRVKRKDACEFITSTTSIECWTCSLRATMWVMPWVSRYNVHVIGIDVVLNWFGEILGDPDIIRGKFGYCRCKMSPYLLARFICQVSSIVAWGNRFISLRLLLGLFLSIIKSQIWDSITLFCTWMVLILGRLISYDITLCCWWRKQDLIYGNR